jgi:hypothetical protein
MRIERRRLRDQMNPFEAPDSEFMNNFRLSKELTQNLIEWLRPYVPGRIRSTGLPLFLRVLSTLHFLAKRSFCTHSLESNASNIQRSLRNECFPVDSNVKIAKNTGPLRHSKKNLS